MAMHDETIRSLREALRVSPENVPLRKHLAEVLMASGQFAEAQREYQQALTLQSDSIELKLGLATAYYRQEKDSHALVVVEDLIRTPHAPPSAGLLYARLLLRAGDVQKALAHYRSAVDAQPDLADPALEERFGIGVEEEADAEVVEGRVRARHEEPGGALENEFERPTATFADVGGMDALKEEIRLKIIHPLAQPEIYAAYGKKIGGGILLYGPPGCGKTHIARATAGEVKASFLAIGIHDVLDMWIGQSERNLHALFDQARRRRPCVLFFDEVDALGASRSDMRQSAGRQLINQFLAELDGIESANDGLLMLAATNAPWHLDSAFRRPGRFDRLIFVPPPDAPARAAILGILLRNKPVADVDTEFLAKKTEGFSGADLKAVVETAIEAKLGEALKTGVPAPLTTKDLRAAAKGLKPTTSEWFSAARNYALYANQGGFYDEILKYLKI
ncbi:MAG TPA: AAA family ATPase [Phycisphaerae bacterium]|nr:AAA family ATPase [Phycisphaerales bacterium]HRX86731.1 AAA family ATPase [Phycisphaerae bacterium]